MAWPGAAATRRRDRGRRPAGERVGQGRSAQRYRSGVRSRAQLRGDTRRARDAALSGRERDQDVHRGDRARARGRAKAAPGDPLARYLAGVVPAGAKITIRELLDHRSGLANYTTIRPGTP